MGSVMDNHVTPERAIENIKHLNMVAPNDIKEIANHYDEQNDYFQKTGAPLVAWRGYFMFPLGSVLLAVLGPLCTRLYIGTGYWVSISDTWHDRNIHSFIGSLTTTAVQNLEMATEVAHEFHAGGSLTGVLSLCI